MFVAVDNTNTFFSDNPYYFYNDDKSPCTPDSQTSSKGFAFFKRRNSKGAQSTRTIIPEQIRLINSANLDSAATIVLGNQRSSFGSLCGLEQHPSFELEPLMCRQRSSNSHSETFRERVSSYNESNSNRANDDVFNGSPGSRKMQHGNHNEEQTHQHQHHHHHHHTLPSNGTRRHSFSNWRQASERSAHHPHHKNSSLILTDEVPDMMAPRPPQISPNKFRGGTHKRRIGYNMDDILIITAKHSERAILRANFLKNHFDKITKQRGRKPFNFLHIKIEDGPFSEEITNKYQNTVLQIIILCPALVALSHKFLMSQLSAILRPEKVLGILLDVSEDKINEIQKTALPQFYKWRRCMVRDNDQAQISNILGIATDILGRALCQRPTCHDGNNSGISRSFSSCSEGFTILPKKVKIGQNKVVAMLAEPLEKDDVLKLAVEKSGELIEIRNFKCRNPFTVQFAIPEFCMEVSTMIEVRIEKNNKSLGARPIKCESRLRELEQLLRNEDSPIEFMCHSLGIGPTDRDNLDSHLLECFKKNMPTNFHLLNGPYEKQQNFLTIHESRPEEYPTLLHFAARWGLNRLCIQLMECPGGDTACGIRNCAGKTPAELADQEKHHKLAQNIVSFSEFHELTTMYHYFKGVSNTCEKGDGKVQPGNVLIEAIKTTPTSPTKANAFGGNKTSGIATQKIPSMEYMEMSSSSERENTPDTKQRTETLAISNLNYISVETEDENLQGSSADVCKNFDSNKVITSPEVTTKELSISEPPYYQSQENNRSMDVVDASSTTGMRIQTDKFSLECSQLLESYPGAAANGNDYVLQPSNIPIAMALVPSKMDPPSNSLNDNNDNDGNYLYQPSNRPVEVELLPQSRQHLNRSFSANSRTGSNPTYGTLKRTVSDVSSTTTTRSNVDDELVEIMHDFKNSVLSIRDVEMLVEKWKHRNDVQQSFREKQEQLEQMRREYERIQQQLKSHLKRETPFERIRKFFSRHKSAPQLTQKGSCVDSVLDETKSSITTASSCKSAHRPTSSLSLQSVSSSNSSGRLSTGSNCSGTSLGDSGTHSDHDDRRFGCRLGNPGSLMDNYVIPPTPRPVFTPNSTPGEERHQITFPSPMSSCTRLNSPTSPTNTEHYQIFPSNIPVYTSQNGHASSSSLSSSHNSNSNYLNTIMEQEHKESDPNYQNGVTLQPIKVKERSNIIYGKLIKSPATCSSFKPKTTTIQQSTLNPPSSGNIEVQAEVYHNGAKNQVARSPEEMPDSNRNKEDTGENHNYMNC